MWCEDAFGLLVRCFGGLGLGRSTASSGLKMDEEDLDLGDERVVSCKIGRTIGVCECVILPCAEGRFEMLFEDTLRGCCAIGSAEFDLVV